MSYLKELRFEQAHLELMHNEHLSVTDVAFKWGFTHLGRFSQEYKRRYGELPSSTRRSGQSEGSGLITSIFLKLKIDKAFISINIKGFYDLEMMNITNL